MNRRDFLRTAGAGLVASALPRPVAAQAATGARRPNILLIMADDMGFSDIGCYGGEIQTPNLDRLAGNGLRFTQFYNAARCCPTRASLLTGLYPHQAGVGAMVSDLGRPAYQGYLNDRCVTIAEALKQGGYRTYMSGKWHVGEEPEHWPRRRGFDRYFGLISGASSYWEILEQPDRERRMALDDMPWKPVTHSFYMTDAFTDFAVDCLDAHAGSDAPFFMYVPYTAPHWPLHAWPEDIAKYRGRYDAGWDALRAERHRRQLDMGIVDPAWPASPRDPDIPAWDDRDRSIDFERRMEVYAAMVDRMDQGIGRIVDRLEAMGELDNTLILFLSDNGACHENLTGRELHDPESDTGARGSYVAYMRPWAHAGNTPFRLFKSWTHEGGIATPLVAHWPRGIEARGGLTHEVGHIVDIMATCLDVAGVPYPETYKDRPVTPVEGKSLLPVFHEGRRTGHEGLYWEHLGNRAVRQGDWKLVSKSREGDNAWELYNMAEDRTELNNLADAEPERRSEMIAAYNAWAARCGVEDYATLRGG